MTIATMTSGPPSIPRTQPRFHRLTWGPGPTTRRSPWASRREVVAVNRWHTRSREENAAAPVTTIAANSGLYGIADGPELDRMSLSMAPRLSAIALCALVGACGSPAAPTPASHAGQWSGTTAQGRPIAFTMSPDDVITVISLGHQFNGCSGSQTFSNLSLSTAPRVECIPAPCPASVPAFRSFNFASRNSDDGSSIDVNGLFASNARAEGSVNFRNFPGCGSAIGVGWTATRR